MIRRIHVLWYRSAISSRACHIVSSSQHPCSLEVPHPQKTISSFPLNYTPSTTWTHYQPCPGLALLITPPRRAHHSTTPSAFDKAQWLPMTLPPSHCLLDIVFPGPYQRALQWRFKSHPHQKVVRYAPLPLRTTPTVSSSHLIVRLGLLQIARQGL